MNEIIRLRESREKIKKTFASRASSIQAIFSRVTEQRCTRALSGAATHVRRRLLGSTESGRLVSLVYPNVVFQRCFPVRQALRIQGSEQSDGSPAKPCPPPTSACFFHEVSVKKITSMQHCHLSFLWTTRWPQATATWIGQSAV